MSKPFLRITRTGRRFSHNQEWETLEFTPGVNTIVGPPGGGKTKWLETIDHLLGKEESDPFEAFAPPLNIKYDRSFIEIAVGERNHRIERFWQSKGHKSKLIVNNDVMSPKEFQQWLLDQLKLPLVHYPKGNPYSGHTWPELSFRTLLRHIYRRQNYWSDIADKQPESQQVACVLFFTGLAENVFSREYESLVSLENDIARFRAKKEIYIETIRTLAGEILPQEPREMPERQAVSNSTVELGLRAANARIDQLNNERETTLQRLLSEAMNAENTDAFEAQAEHRAALQIKLESLSIDINECDERFNELQLYKQNIEAEIERFQRAQDSNVVLADLKVTHCPACDQPVHCPSLPQSECFLCHQASPDLAPPEHGLRRVELEMDRLKEEVQELKPLLESLETQKRNLAVQSREAKDQLKRVDQELRPIRIAVSAIANNAISQIDMALGEAHARRRQIDRINSAFELGEDLARQIEEKEKLKESLEEIVKNQKSSIDYDETAESLEAGINEYLSKIQKIRPDVWEHKGKVSVRLSSSSLQFKIGKQRWSKALGATDQLYFLLAYHYALLSLSTSHNSHYPGFLIIDIPGDLVGMKVSDLENFVVQPFVDLLDLDLYADAQVLITGSSYEGLEGVNQIALAHVHSAPA